MRSKRGLIIFFILWSPTLYFPEATGFHENLKANCKYCHINESEMTNTQNLIWQKQIQSIYFTPYSSSTFDAEASVPLSSSKLCLSCHDGTLTMEHLNLPNLSMNQIISTNLLRSHPVSFKYDAYLAFKDGELYDPSSSPSGLGGTISSDLLFEGRLECISCHDIHGLKKHKNFLVMSNYRSRLCLTCHSK